MEQITVFFPNFLCIINDKVCPLRGKIFPRIKENKRQKVLSFFFVFFNYNTFNYKNNIIFKNCYLDKRVSTRTLRAGMIRFLGCGNKKKYKTEL